MNPVTESPIRDDTIPVTTRSYERLCLELRRMCAEHRQEMDEQLLQGRGEGTLADNPELLSLSWETARAWSGEYIAEVEASSWTCLDRLLDG